MSESSVNINSEQQDTESENVVAENIVTTSKHTKIPLAKIKNIMKMDPDASLISNEAIFLVTKATELFIDSIAKESYAITAKGKRKMVSKKDFQTVLDTLDCLCFLEGALDI